jgi:hypothetical protein
MAGSLRWIAPALTVLVVFGAAPAANATNGLHPRTKVVWSEGTCGITVVRSESATVTLPYTLPDANMDGMIDMCDDDPTPGACTDDPVPNVPVGPDEVSDSRKHQFFAFCRQSPLDVLFPNWISDADVEAASQVEYCCEANPNDCPGKTCPLADPAAVSANDVLDSNPDWEGCFARINGDDARRPISVEQAQAGITWDTSAVDPGVYSIEGYTWEPPFNLWSRRPGFVKVVDEAADAAKHPAGAIMSVSEEKADDLVIDGCEQITIEGCVDAGEGATMDVFWRHPTAGGPIEWHRIVADEPVENGNFAIDWSPEALPSELLLLRVDVKDACGTYTAHAPFALNVLDGEECEEGGVFGGGDTGGEPDDFVDDQNNRDENTCVGGTGGDAGADDGKTGGCNCRSESLASGATNGALWGIPLIALFAWGRRRRGATTP